MQNEQDTATLQGLIQLIQERFEVLGDRVGQVLCSALLSLIEPIEPSRLFEPPKGQDDWVKEAVNLRQQGLSWEKIAELVGKPATTVRRRCKSLIK